MKNKTFLVTIVTVLFLVLPCKYILAQNCPVFIITYRNSCNYGAGYSVYLRAELPNGEQINGSNFTWSFGDGTANASNTGYYPNNQWHNYTNTGFYTVSLTYTVPGCGTETVYKTIEVKPMDSYFTASTTSPLKDAPVVLNFGLTEDDAQPEFTYSLTIDGGAPVAIVSPYTVSFNTTGPHTLILYTFASEYCYLRDTIQLNVSCPSCSNYGVGYLYPACAGSPIHFINNVANCAGLTPDQLTFNWNYGDGTTSTGFAPDHIYTSPGTYTVTMSYQYEVSGCAAGNGGSINVVVGTCPPPPCEDCIGSFAPTTGEYILSTWVKQANGENLITYDKAGVKVTCATLSGNVVAGPFYPDPKGKIIDGWQRIEKKFSVPPNTSHLGIELLNTGTSDAFFDDIRIHPVNGNMKSYVYDPITLRLSAELDENNYATFYEYDEEGNLVRVKKETERGIMTIKESRSNNSKQP